MKLSVWSSYYYVLSPENMLREFKKHGYNYTELSSEHSEMLLERGDPKIVGEEFSKIAKEMGIEIIQGHLFFWEKRICNPEDRALIKKQLDLFKAIGIKNAVLHCDSLKKEDGTTPSYDIVREENIKAIADILDHVKGTDIVICLENLISCDATNSVKGLMYFIDYFKSENLGICLDTGHLNLRDKDQVAFIRKAGKHIKALHLADNEGKNDQHLMPYGKGHVNFKDVICEMKKLGYEGLYNLEIPGERQAPLEILGYKLEYIKKMMAYLDRETE